jgi:hypothetical protein
MKHGFALFLAGLIFFAIPAQSEQKQRPHFLQAIIFESYLTPPPDGKQLFDVFDLPSNDFPVKFSRLFMPFGISEAVQLPSGLDFPKNPMFLDIYSFTVAEEQIKKQKSFSHYNSLQRLDYKIKVLSWTQDSYRVALSGRHENFKFKTIAVESAVDKTKIIRIRRNVNRTIYIALTELESANLSLNGVIPPQPISRPWAVYPSELRGSNWYGSVKIFARITSEGKADDTQIILFDCPHYILGRNSLDAVLNQWTFKPATKDGIPAAADAILEVEFLLSKPRGSDMSVSTLP